MSVHPLNDRVKIEIDKDPFDLDSDKTLNETGIVVEVPDTLLYAGFHSFAFENSVANDAVLDRVQDFYAQLRGKRVYWEKLQDSGRHLKDNGKEYVFLQMTDILAYSDDVNEKAEVVGGLSSSNSFNLE